MTDILARQRAIVGTTGEWAVNDRVLGDGELAIERAHGGMVKAKVGDGFLPFGAAPYLNDNIPGPLRYKGNADPTAAPPAGAVPGDAYSAEPAGTVDASWGPPAAGKAAAAGDLIIMDVNGAWNVLPVGIAGVVYEVDLAAPTGAGMVGTSKYTPGVIPAGLARPLNSVITDNGYDATWDVIKARTLPGYAGDQDAINAVAAVQPNWCLNPAVGVIDARAQINLPLPNSRVIFLGGKQQIRIDRHLSHAGHTLQAGSPAQGCVGLVLENIFITHQGRQGYSGGGTLPTRMAGGGKLSGPFDPRFLRPGMYDGLGKLPGRQLTGDQAHIMIHGAQSAQVRDCGGWGAAHFIRMQECHGVAISDPFIFGGVWDPDYPAAQEAVSAINIATGINTGRNSRIVIRGGEIYGSQAGANRSVVVGGMTVNAPRRAGPLCGVMVNSCEDWLLDGVFVGLMASHSVFWAPDSASAYNANGIIQGCNIDESNDDCIGVYRRDASYLLPDTLKLTGNTFNGQFVSRNLMSIISGPGGIDSLLRLESSRNTWRACLGAAVHLFGARGVDLSDENFAGWNIAYSDDASEASAVVIGDVTRDVSLTGLRLGGGVNGYDEPGTPDANGLSANGCKYGIFRRQLLTNICAARLYQMPFGKAGGSFLIRLKDDLTYTVVPSEIFDAPTFA